MKKPVIFNLILICIGFAACLTSKKTTYELPEAMLPEVKIEYAKICEKGYQLYQLSCAKCHSTKKNGRVRIPDFNEDQLTGYTLRISNARHETNLPDSLVSEEELVSIMTFLKYKRKN